jgi:multidrug efflux pump
MPFDIIMGGIGCISLAGVVVNNAIVLLDFARQKINEGIPLRDALIETGVVRFRPVMLTAVTTILGLIPMAAGITYDFRTGEWIIGGESSQWWGPLAISVAYGLGFATLLTLIVVPTLYFVLLRFRAAIGLGDLEAQRAQGVVIE